jgi:transcriptional regulator with XRE-family HTH domain
MTTDKTSAEYIGSRVRARREKRKLSRQDCALVVGVSQQQIAKYETGVSEISGTMLAKLAGLLDVHPGYFFK